MYLLKRKYVFAAIYSLLLVSFTVYAALDTFVTSRIYTVVPDNTSSMADTSTEENNTDSTDMAVTTENSYSDENISIKISNIMNLILRFM